MSIRWVVVGFGMGQVHARFIKACDGFTLLGVCDFRRDLLDVARNEHGDIRTYTRYEDVLADGDVDAVAIVTPHNVHAAMSIAAMETGKHVVTDKAMCLSVSEARAMMAARDRAGVLLSTFHNRRWDRDFLTVRKLVDEGRLGRLYHIESCVTFYGQPGGWRASRESMGGWLFDWGAHTIDQILALCGDMPTSVYAVAHHRYSEPGEVEDFIDCMIRFDRGVTARTVVGYLNRLPMPRWYVMGEAGTLRAEGFDTPVRVAVAGDDGDRTTDEPLVDGEWVSYYHNVADALAGRAELLVRPEQLLPQIAIAEAAYRSVASGATEPVAM